MTKNSADRLYELWIVKVMLLRFLVTDICHYYYLVILMKHFETRYPFFRYNSALMTMYKVL